MVTVPAAYTRQLATGGTISQSGQLQQLGEDTPDLCWPNSTVIYDRMRKDAKVAAVLRAQNLPIRGTGWHIPDTPDVAPEITGFCRRQLGIDTPTSARRGTPGQHVSWDAVLRHALLSLPYGHMFFEPVYRLGPPAPGSGLKPGEYAHLARLAPILPRTIGGFHIAPDGELASIDQQTVAVNGRWQTISIPRALLIPVINDMEGSDWAGNSILRSSYKHWFMKDKLERLGLMVVERNGMGVPVAEYGPDQDRAETQRSLSAFRAGDMAGAAFPQGTNVQLLGVTGTLADPMPQIAYHSQEIARSTLAMFLDLGHDNGARSLGDTFVEYFALSLNAVLAQLEETFTEELLRPLVELNFGAGVMYPQICADRIRPEAALTAEAISAMVTAGVITPDASLDAWARRTFNIDPASDPGQSPGTVDVGDPGEGTTAMSGTLPERQTRLDMMRRRVFQRRQR